MAWQKVELTEEEMKSGGGRQWKKFEAIGDKVVAFLVKKETATAQYKDGPKEVTKWVFYGQLPGRPSPEEFEITPPGDLKQRLEKAERERGLRPGVGHLVKIVFTKTRTVEGQSDPKKIFDVDVDTEPNLGGKTLPASVTWAKPKPAEVMKFEKPAPDDDIPF